MKTYDAIFNSTDPEAIIFTLPLRDGGSFEMNMDIMNDYYRYFVRYAISRGIQTGVIFMTLVTLIACSPTERIIKKNIFVQIISLGIGLIKTSFLLQYSMSNWTNMYNVMSNDFSTLPDSDYRYQVVLTVFNILLIIGTEAMMILHGWTVMRMWNPVPRWFGIVVSTFVALAAICLRSVGQVFILRASLASTSTGMTTTDSEQYVIIVSIIMLAVSTFWFAAVFNAKLVGHIWKTRRLLLRTNGMSPMEILIMTNGLLMIIPVIIMALSITDYAIAVDFNTWSTTSIIVVLPFGSLVAQRLVGKNQVQSLNHISPLSAGHGNNSSIPVYQGASAMGGRHGSDVTNKTVVEAGSASKYGHDNSLDGSGVRVDRDVEQMSEHRLI